MRTDITKINEKTAHTGLTEGMHIYAAGTSRLFNTGEWRNNTPVYDESKCKHCFLCAPVCPDSSILTKGGKMQGIDLEHCKGCGICVAVCPFHAITMKEGIE